MRCELTGGTGKHHGASEYCEGPEKVVAFWQKYMGVDRIPAQEARMSTQMEAEKYGNI